MAKNTADPVGTLSIGNVVTTGTILYKSNFKRYFQVSLRATAWVIAIIVLAIGLEAISNIKKSLLISIPLSLGSVALTLYFLAKYMTDRAIICRLAYQELIDAPETVSVATQYLIPRTWGFLRLAWLVGLYMFFVVIISSVALFTILIAIVAAMIYGLKISTPDPFTSVCIFFLTLGLFLLSILMVMRYYAYWFIAELPLAIESTTSANFSIRRSRQLNATAARRVMLIIAIALILVLPINVIASMPLFSQIISNSTISINRSTQFTGNTLILVGIFSIVSELFVMPFWQAIKAIIYYDLRNRQEGSDLII
jgi:hypothetical protein